MYGIVLVCHGVPESAGEDAAAGITSEFAQHRPWYTSVSCTWDGSRLILRAESDVDCDGSALIDEFSDCTAAYIEQPFDGEIEVESIVRVPAGA